MSRASASLERLRALDPGALRLCPSATDLARTFNDVKCRFGRKIKDLAFLVSNAEAWRFTSNSSKKRLFVLRRDERRCRSCNLEGDEFTLDVPETKHGSPRSFLLCPSGKRRDLAACACMSSDVFAVSFERRILHDAVERQNWSEGTQSCYRRSIPDLTTKQADEALFRRAEWFRVMSG